ncbi:MAG: sugar ABC transporter substrate-binding protein [Firmicutes bacterium]|nr:sugar ABC transporter substrate-binding protein [Bacillota bacterium]
MNGRSKACLLRMLLVLSCLFSVVGCAASTTIQFLTYGLTLEHWQRMADRFMASNPDIEVELGVYTYGEYNEKLVTQIAGGLAPDLIQVWAQYKLKYIELGWLRDITSQWEKSSVIKQARFYSFALDAARHKGRFYGVPFDYNSQIWYVNVDHLSDSGAVLPSTDWTIDDFTELARKLTNQTKGIYGTLNMVRNAGTENLQWSQIWTGHDWVSPDHKRVLVDSPEYIEMLTFWYELQNTLNVTPGWPGYWGYKGTFYQGGVALWQGWLSYANSMIWRGAKHDWAFALMPKAPAGQDSFAQGHMFSIPVVSDQPEAAWRMAEWMMSDEGHRSMVEDLERHPIGPYSDLWSLFFRMTGPEKADYARDFVMHSFYGPNLVRTMNYWISYPEANTILAEHLRNIFANQAPIGNEMRNAAAKIQRLLDEQ